MIMRKLGYPENKTPLSLDEFGNTSSASIPLTLVTRMGEQLKNDCNSIMACGFGVGLSWGAVAFKTDSIVVSKLIEL